MNHSQSSPWLSIKGSSNKLSVECKFINTIKTKLININKKITAKMCWQVWKSLRLVCNKIIINYSHKTSCNIMVSKFMIRSAELGFVSNLQRLSVNSWTIHSDIEQVKLRCCRLHALLSTSTKIYIHIFFFQTNLRTTGYSCLYSTSQLCDNRSALYETKPNTI